MKNIKDLNSIPKFIKGGIVTDYRGSIRFVNDFNMDLVKRFYIIENSNIEIIRAWRAHRIEQRWFHVLQGTFKVAVVKIDNWDSPSKDLPIENYILSSQNVEIFHVPAGYGMSIQAMEAKSRLIVFADRGIEHAKLDDYLFPEDYFIA